MPKWSAFAFKHNPDWFLSTTPRISESLDPCPDCGQNCKRVWGNVDRDDAAVAAYSVKWTPSQQSKDAMVDLIIGKWGEVRVLTIGKPYRIGRSGQKLIALIETKGSGGLL
jgi:hypothetical protein